MPGRDELDSLLDTILAEPGRRPELQGRIDSGFVEERTMLVLDMSGFSRATRRYGIIECLLVIRRVRALTTPLVAKRGGDVVKAEADNLFCLFRSVEEAVTASREIVETLEQARVALPQGEELYVSIGIGFGPMLLIGAEDAMGSEVNLACKLGEDVADYGEILLTEAARAALRAGEPVEERVVSMSGIELKHFALVS